MVVANRQRAAALSATKLPARVMNELHDAGIRIQLSDPVEQIVNPQYGANGLLPDPQQQAHSQRQNPLRLHRQKALNTTDIDVLLAAGGRQNMLRVGQILANNSMNVQFNSPNINQLPTAQLLRKPVLEAKFIEKLAPTLIFEDFTRRLETDSIDITYLRDLKSHFDDANKLDPAEIGPGGEFPDVLPSDPVQRHASLAKFGFKLRFTRDAMINANTAFDQVTRKITRAAWWYGHFLNTKYANVLTGSWSTSQIGDDAVRVEGADNVWSAAASDPIKDIRDLAYKMQTEDDYFIQPTDFYINPDNFREFLDYLNTISQTWALNPMSERITQITLDGIRIHNVPPQSGVQASSGLMLASPQSDPPLTVYEKVDRAFSRSGILHIHDYMDNETHDHVWQLWKYFAVILQSPKSVGIMHTM